MANQPQTKRRRILDPLEQLQAEMRRCVTFHRPPPLTLSKDQERYKVGTVLRVSLVNFVTYDKATFHIGPHLNVVIGPNGTGKSTLVCALALGLGARPEVLGFFSVFVLNCCG